MLLKQINALILVTLITGVGNTSQAQKQIALTIDDLPYNVPVQDIDIACQSVQTLTRKLKQAGVKATAFITVQNILIDGQVDERIKLMEFWKKAGVQIENHGYRHLSYNNVPVEEYFQDIQFAELFLELEVMNDSAQVKYYRAPYNHVGADSLKAAQLVDYLKTRKIQLAPFTIENGDYIYNKVYLHYLNSRNPEKAEKVREEYITQLDRSLNFAEDLAQKTFDKPIPQILLIHSNAINAASIDEMIDYLRGKGYTFVSLEEALKDKVYKLNEIYPSPWGFSWIHRWRKSMGMSNELRFEPEPSSEIMKLWNEL